MHVLIVDDEKGFRDLAERILHQAGHTTCWATTGTGALRILYTERIDAMILDMHLTKEMSGWEVARVKYADPQLRQIPLIIVSTVPAKELKEGARTNVLTGEVTTMTKPLDQVALLAFLGSIKIQRPSDPPTFGEKETKTDADHLTIDENPVVEKKEDS